MPINWVLNDEDLLIEIWSFCSPTEAVRLWIGTNFFNRSVDQNHMAWECLLNQTKLVDLEGALLRLNLRTFHDETQLPAFNLLRELHSVRRCSRSGCYQLFREIENLQLSSQEQPPNPCSYHPGILRRTTRRLSCCRQKGFDSRPCKQGVHDGGFFSAVFTARPDPQVKSRPPPTDITSVEPAFASLCVQLPSLQVDNSKGTAGSDADQGSAASQGCSSSPRADSTSLPFLSPLSRINSG